MKIKLYISVLLVVLSFAKANAQVPGYLGKKFLAGYELTSVYNVSHPNANLNSGLASFSLMHTVKAEYVIARATSVGFSATYGRTGWNGNSYYYSFEEGAKILNIIESGFYFNFFKYSKRGSIAPLGSYGTIGVNWFSYTPSTPAGTVLQDPNMDESHWARLHGTHFYFSLGRRWLLKDRFMPSISMTTGLYVNSYLLNPESTYSYYGGPSNAAVDNEKEYRNTSADRMANFGVFQFNVGLSYLIF